MNNIFTEEELRVGLRERYGWSDTLASGLIADIQRRREPEYLHGGWYVDASDTPYEYNADSNNWFAFGTNVTYSFDVPKRPLRQLVLKGDATA